MPRKIVPAWGVVPLIAAALALVGSQPIVRAGEPRRITLAYFADLHAQLEPHPELYWSGGRDELVGDAGGLARLASAIGSIRRERPGRVLVMDAGDTIQGAAAAAWSRGAAVVPPLNALGLDLAIPGNWEVVYGKDVLLRRAGELRHPMICANLRDAGTGRPVFRPYLIKEVGGVRVAVIGFTDPDVPERQPPSYSRGLSFDEDDVLQPMIDRVRKEERAEVVVVLSHIGLPKAIALAGRLEGVDVMFSGDTHERTYQPIVRGRTWIVEPGSFGSFLGRLDLAVEGGRIIDRRWDLIELRAGRFGEDPGVAASVAAALAPTRGRAEAVIGRTEVPLVRYSVVETDLDDVLADAIRAAAGTEIGLSNGFRFAPPTLPGPIRERDLWDWFPITNRLKTGVVTGAQLRLFWEGELEHVFAEDPRELFGGWLPRVSGMSVRFAARRPAGHRVIEIGVGGQPIRDDRRYTIAACEREGDPTDRLCRIPGVADPRTLDVDAHQAVRRYLAGHSPIRRPEMGRVVAVDLPDPLRSQILTSAPDRPDRRPR